MSQWTARIELFTAELVPKWVLVDPKGIIRATFNGIASDDKETPRLIARLLNEHTGSRT